MTSKESSPSSEGSETFVDAAAELDEVTKGVEELNVESDFSLITLEKHFADCLADPNINHDSYLQGYRELYKFLTMLGTVFTWVATDVKNKIDVLQRYLDSEEKEKYKNVKEMIEYEIEQGSIKTKKKDDPSGSRTLLRLHRALEYIIAFLDAVQKLNDEDRCSVVSREAYENTLMKYHLWVVQKAAKVAMGLLPTKRGLVEKIVPNATEDEVKKAQVDLQKAIDTMQKVYDICQDFYRDKNLLDIP